MLSQMADVQRFGVFARDNAVSINVVAIGVGRAG
jgi:hypothetical protein